jgi:5,6-dimethylbenzimidazole synthase
MPVLDERRREVLADHLGIPVSWHPTGAFCFGYPPTARLVGPSRGPLEAIAFSEVWGSGYERIAFRESGDFPRRLPDIEVMEAIRNLREVESFQPGAVEPWMVERIIDAAIWSPNPENTKHWRFIIVRDSSSKEFLYKLVKEKSHTPLHFMDMEAQYARLWYLPPEERLRKIERLLEDGIGGWYPQADVLLIVVSSYFNWLEQPYLVHIAPNLNQAFPIATGCALQNMMLAATALGLGVNFDPTPVIDSRSKELFLEYFNIPSSWFPLGVLSIGQPGEKLEQPPPPPLESLVFDEYWGNVYQPPTSPW